MTSVDLAALAARITSYVGYLDVEVSGWGSALPYSCAQILAEQEAGADPTAAWRDGVCRAQQRRYGTVAPASVGAAFVLGWYLQVVAVPAAFGAVAGDVLLDVSPESLRFDLDEMDLYPVVESFSPEGAIRDSHPQMKVLRARQAYEAHAMRFAESYSPRVRMGSKQRLGMVRDVWAASLDTARRSVGADPAPLGLRESCCFIYALPGAHVCERCPRRRVR